MRIISCRATRLRDAMLAECRFENHRFVAFSRLPLAIIYNRGW